MAVLLTCPSAPCALMLAHAVLSTQLPGCTSDSSCAAWAAPHFITVRSSWQWAVKLRSPLPHPAQSHAPRRDKAYGAVCPDQDIPSSDAVPGWGALCHALSLASLSYGDFCSTAQDPKILCQCRAEELVLPQTFWQGPAISICIMETVAHQPSTHSEIFLGLAVLMRER